MAKGDYVTVIPRTGPTRTIDAEQNGRRVTVEITTDSGVKWLSVAEVTRGGTIVRYARYQLSDVISYERRGE
jgi:hypothetical protein